MYNFNNIEWFWNNNNNSLPLATSPNFAAGITSPSFYNNTSLTDVGICVGMQNVNINSKNVATFLPRKIQNCCQFNMIGKLTEDNFNNACNDYLYRQSFYNVLHPNVSHKYMLSQNQHHRNEVVTPHLPKHRDCVLFMPDQFFSTSNAVKITSNRNYVSSRQNAERNSSWKEAAGPNEVKTADKVGLKESTAIVPKKKWIKHYMMGE